MPPTHPPPHSNPTDPTLDGYTITARALKAAGIRVIFGVIGIPVTQLASAAQAEGIRFIGTRNEQAAGYAAGAYGYLTGTPGVLLTVSGPGAVHGIAGLSNAQVNTWPMIMVSGSSEQREVGHGSFQELDQVAAAAPYCKYAGRATRLVEIAQVVYDAVNASVQGKPGAAYVDIPSDVLMATNGGEGEMEAVRRVTVPSVKKLGAGGGAVAQAVALLQGAQRCVFFCVGGWGGDGGAWVTEVHG